MPVLDAMVIGTPVVVSRVSSLPEVCGEAAIYIEDPKSSESIYLALNKALEFSGKERENLVKLGLIQVQLFSWQKTAEKILDNLID
jgi:glycosyltransferase involved in cell wall biosynthesis